MILVALRIHMYDEADPEFIEYLKMYLSEAGESYVRRHEPNGVTGFTIEQTSVPA